MSSVELPPLERTPFDAGDLGPARPEHQVPESEPAPFRGQSSGEQHDTAPTRHGNPKSEASAAMTRRVLRDAFRHSGASEEKQAAGDPSNMPAFSGAKNES